MVYEVWPQLAGCVDAGVRPVADWSTSARERMKPYVNLLGQKADGPSGK